MRYITAFGKKEGSGFVEITCEYTDDGHVKFIVKDDGVGFDPAFHSENKDIESPSSLPKLGGVGINNVDERLKLYYGKEYGVHIQSLLGEGTTVTIVIP